MDELLADVRAFVAGHVDPPVTDDQDLFDTGLVNSLFAVQLAMWVERTFQIPLRGDDLDLANFCSVEAVARFVAARRQEPAVPVERSCE